MKKVLKIFLVVSIIFISSFLINYKVKAYTSIEISLDYFAFTDLYEELSDVLDSAMQYGESHYSEYIVTFGRSMSDNTYWVDVYDLSNFSSLGFFTLYNAKQTSSTYYSSGIQLSNISVQRVTYQYNISSKNVTGPGLSSAGNISFFRIHSTSQGKVSYPLNLNDFFHNHPSLYAYDFYIPYYSTLDINISPDTTNFPIFYLNGERLYANSILPTYYDFYNSSNIDFSNTCNDSLECGRDKVTLTIPSNKLDKTKEYYLKYYTSDGYELYYDYFNDYLSDNDFVYEHYFGNDIGLIAELYATGNELIERKEYNVDVKFDKPHVQFLTYKGTEWTTVNIYYFDNNYDNLRYFHQYSNGGVWYDSLSETFTVLEFNSIDSKTIEGRIIDSETGEIVAYSKILVGLNDLPIVQFQIQEHDNDYDLKVYVTNLKENYHCSYDINGSDEIHLNVCELGNDVYIYDETLLKSKDFEIGITIYDELGNVVILESYHNVGVDKDNYNIDSNRGSIIKYIDDYILKHQKNINRLSVSLQSIVDESPRDVINFLIFVYVLFCMFFTIRLGGGK